MATLKVSVRLVDGALQEFSESLEFYKKYLRLKSADVSGKELIHQLISDDWAAPPCAVYISGISERGEKIDIQIPYE